MLDILIVTDIAFWRRAFGSQQRIYRIVQHLIKARLQVGVQFVHGCMPPNHLPELTGVKVFPLPTTGRAEHDMRRCLRNLKSKTGQFLRAIPFVGKYFQYAMTMLRRIMKRCRRTGNCAGNAPENSKSIHDFVSEPDVPVVCETINREQPKVVILEYLHTAYLIKRIRKSAEQAPLTMIDTIDVLSERAASFRKMGVASWIEIDAQTELRLADEADVVIAIQSEDAVFFKNGLRKAKVITVPHCHEISAIQPPESRLRIILFVGGRGMANTSGIKKFISTCWPKVREQFGSEVRLRIVGNICKNLANFANEKGVELAGFVDSLEDEYRQASVFIAPIEYGSGLKIKVVEALCYGKALVATECAVQGLKDGAGEAFCMSGNIEAMAGDVINILQNHELRSKLEKSALRFAKAHFSEKVCFREFDQVLTETTHR